MKEIDLAGTFFRLIPSRFPPVSVYEGLVSENLVDRVAEIEALTNPRLDAARTLRRNFSDAASPALQNWNSAPFRYLNPEGSTFFPPERPALEIADCEQTAVIVSVRRREEFLRRTAEGPCELDMRVLKTPFRGRFFDFRPLQDEGEEPDRYRFGAEVPPGRDGVLFHPSQRPSATCVSILRADALGRSTQTNHYRFIWNGTKIEKLYAYNNERNVLDPDELSGEDELIAN